MKIISWNCNMAFRKKWKVILDMNPDILVVQECEHISKYKDYELIPNLNEFIWIGENPNKGIGIFSFNNYQIQLSENYTDAYKYIIPIEVSGERSFTLFGIWAMPDKKKASSYIGQIWKSLEYYKDQLNKPSLLIGDWNSNQIWDKERKVGNHSQTVQELEKQNICSLYHSINNVNHGEETEPTLYLTKSIEKPYHIDYCFASKELISENTIVKIGSYKNWIKLSDHMPLIVENIAN